MERSTTQRSRSLTSRPNCEDKSLKLKESTSRKHSKTMLRVSSNPNLTERSMRQHNSETRSHAWRTNSIKSETIADRKTPKNSLLTKRSSSCKIWLQRWRRPSIEYPMSSEMPRASQKIVKVKSMNLTLRNEFMKRGCPWRIKKWSHASNPEKSYAYSWLNFSKTTTS